MKRKSTISIVLVIALLASMLVCMFTVNAVAGSSGETVYVRTTGSGTPNCYMWKGGGGAGNQNAAWPGIAMTPVETNVYSYTLDNAYEKVIFNGSFGQTDDLDYPGDGMIYDMSTNKWSQYGGSTAAPVISFSKKDGSSFKSDTVNVTVTVGGADSASYSIDGGSAVQFSGSANVTLGAGVAVGGTTTLSVTATNENGTSTQSITLTKKESAVVGGGDGSTSPALDGYYGTNPNGQVGVKKTISVDGDKSDWDSSMLIAQGTANDDPRVYRENSMYEIPIDDYALYAAWDNDNLYLMWEMANVQDIVAPNDNFPLTQGNLWIYNYPVFLYMYTGQGNLTDGTTAAGTLWDTGTTLDTYTDTVVAFSTNGSNGPFIYTADDNGKLDPDNIVNKNTGISLKWGNGKTLSGKLMGIDGAYGKYNNRTPGDILDEGSAWVDFYEKGHKASLDSFYEMSIPLSSLNISSSDIEKNGIGVLKVSTYGMSGMDCLPYDLSMSDNADLPYSKQEPNSHEKEDEDHITVPFARIGKLLSSDPTPTPPPTSEPVPTSSETQPVSKLGDVDGDGQLSVSDATLIQKYKAGFAVSINIEVADVDKDGQITVTDATLIQKVKAGIETL